MGYVIPAIRAHSGLSPFRQCSCRAYYQEPISFQESALIFGSSDISSEVELQLVLDKGVTFLAALRITWVSSHDEGVFATYAF